MTRRSKAPTCFGVSFEACTALPSHRIWKASISICIKFIFTEQHTLKDSSKYIGIISIALNIPKLVRCKEKFNKFGAKQNLSEDFGDF